MEKFVISVAALSAIYAFGRFWANKVQRSRKQAYRHFLQEDRMQSTLEYQRDVTRQRQDTRMWR